MTAALVRSNPPSVARSSSHQRLVQDQLARAGIVVGGPAPWDIRVRDERAFRAMALHGSLGFGESYMAGHWECDSLDVLTERLFRNDLTADPGSARVLLHRALAVVRNLQSRARATEVAEKHYDLGNDLFEAMLDSRMVYTCGYWKDAQDLESAQEAKLDLICRKLELRPGMRVLDIGCGFGALMKLACERYGVVCTGYSVSREQTEYARRVCEGLPVEIVLDDYRAIRGRFDRIVSVGMLEAVGYKNFRTFMQVVHDSLEDDGLFLLHTVGHNRTTRNGDPWIEKYIFPNGMLPSIAQLGTAFEDLFVMEDWHNFGTDYDKTLLAWNARFQEAWPRLRGKYGETFKRMWELYLLGFAGGFRARAWQLWQIVLTKPGRRPPACRLV
jgi:cyclopropane-fatty-acyl-phospholipid synthase